MTTMYMYITKRTESDKPFGELLAVSRHFKRSTQVSFPDLQLKLVVKVTTVLMVLTCARTRQMKRATVRGEKNS